MTDDEAWAKIKSPTLTREEFWSLLVWLGWKPRDRRPIFEVYTHPAMPTDMLLTRMKWGNPDAWLNPSADLAILSCPTVLDNPLVTAALRALEVDLDEDDCELDELAKLQDQVREASGPFFAKWRPRILALIADHVARKSGSAT